MVTSKQDGPHGGTGFDADASNPSWSAPSTVSTMTTDCGPRCARIDGVDWVIWKGKSDNYLWYATGSDGQWSIPNGLGIQTSSSPAIAAYNGLVYVFWRDASDDYIYYATYDGHSWTYVPGYRVPGSTTSAGPAAVSFDGKLYLAWNSSSDNCVIYTWFDGASWYAPQKTPTITATHSGPALAIYQNQLFYAYCRIGNVIAVARMSDNSFTTVPNAQSDNGPALASDSENLWVMWKDFISGNLMTSTATAAQPRWTSPAATASGMSTPYSPGMCGDSTGLRCVWANVENFTIQTSTFGSGQPTPPPPPATNRPVPPEIQTAEQNLLWGDTGFSYYVTITVTSVTGKQLANVQTQADSYGNWMYTLDFNLTNGMKVEAVATEEKDSTPSDAFVKVIGQSQDGPLTITAVETDQVSGIAPDTGQVIVAWRASDGAQMTNFTVPPPSSIYDGKTFTAPYKKGMQLADNDLLCVVSQFPDDGTMTPYEREPEGYPGS